MSDNPFIPETAQQALERWDRGDIVASIELGGIGPGYEQAIQILVFELIRDNQPMPADKDDPIWRTWGDATVTRTDKAVGGYSGAQVGAAKHLAVHALKNGWRKTIDSVDKERRIMVSNWFPDANAAAEGGHV